MGQIENKYKMIGLSPTISVITLNINGLNNHYSTCKWSKRRSCQIGFKFFKKQDQIHVACKKHA